MPEKSLLKKQITNNRTKITILFYFSFLFYSKTYNILSEIIKSVLRRFTYINVVPDNQFLIKFWICLWSESTPQTLKPPLGSTVTSKLLSYQILKENT